MPQLQLLIATQNQGKALEFLRLLANTPVSVLDLRSLDPIPAPEENGATFVENAVVKAQYYAAKSGITVLADDSGLEVDALDGRPGVMSARYGGSHLSDAERVEMLLEEMADVPDHERSARFKCVVAFAGPSLATDCITAEGVVEGSIALAPRGANGFGYDPVFVPLGENRTTAQMTGDEKDRLSHRARAIQVAMPKLLILLQP